MDWSVTSLLRQDEEAFFNNHSKYRDRLTRKGHVHGVQSIITGDSKPARRFTTATFDVAEFTIASHLKMCQGIPIEYADIVCAGRTSGRRPLKRRLRQRRQSRLQG